MINSATDLRIFVAETSGIPVEFIGEIRNPSSLNLSDIPKAIVMVFARWSPVPILCLKKMKSVLPQRIGDAKAKFLVIDNDNLSPADMRSLFGKTLSAMSGAAETFVVVSGKIRAESSGCPENYQDVLEELCTKLME